MTALRWAVKRSLIAYVTGMADGELLVRDGAEIDGVDLRFPGTDATSDRLRFRGRAELIGHGGLLHVVLADPELVRGADGWMLRLSDGVERLDFARLNLSSPTAGGLRTATDTRLTADGADLFFGPYQDGTPLDDPIVEG